LFLGIELVADRETKQPLDPALQIHTLIKQAAMQRGLICYPMGGTIDGQRGNHILLAPPFILNAAQIEELVEKLVSAVDAALQMVFLSSAKSSENAEARENKLIF
jgi:adenosylmethionine-8-amino-7-oxononanoate aminotransferase